jgi:hypothetical protein
VARFRVFFLGGLVKRILVIAAAIAAVSGLVSASAPRASASPSASTVRTFVDTWRIVATPIGSGSTWCQSDPGGCKFVDSDQNATVVKPSYEFRDNYQWSYPITAGRSYNHMLTYLVGRSVYVSSSNAPGWKVTQEPAATIAKWAAQSGPGVELTAFRAIPSVRLVGTRHYQVTCTVAQAKGFYTAAYGTHEFAQFRDSGIKTLTISVWVDSAGRLIKDTVTGRSLTWAISAVETFASYNKPLTVKAPI